MIEQSELETIKEMIFERFFSGRKVDFNQLTIEQIKEIARKIAESHNIIQNYKVEENKIDTNLLAKIEKAEIMASPICQDLKENKELLEQDIKNKNDNLEKIKLVSDSRKYLEMIEVGVLLSDFQNYNFKQEIFSIYLKAYFEKSNLDKKVEWQTFLNTYLGIIEWLLFNVDISLDVNEVEKRRKGILNTKNSLKDLLYFIFIKNSLLEELRRV